MVAAKEDPVVATDSHAADGPFSGIIIDFQIPVSAAAGQRRPVLEALAQRPPLRALRQYLRLDLQQVVMKLIEYGV
jgi:hypothetical protein